MKKNVFVFAIALTLLISGTLVAVEGEVNDEGDIVLDEWETDTEPLRFEPGRASFEKNITFEDVGNTTLDIRHETEVIDEHVVQVVEGEKSVEKIETSNEDPRSLQRERDISTSIDAPYEVTVGETKTIEVTVENYIKESQEISFYVDEEFESDITVPKGGDLKRHEYTFSYDLQENTSPEDILFEISGSADRYHKREIRIRRPDSDGLSEVAGFTGTDGEMRLQNVRRGDRVGEFNENISTSEYIHVQENIKDQIAMYLRREHPNAEIPELPEINATQSIFGKSNEDWLEDPELLKGQYNFTVVLEGINLELEEGQVTLMGEYGEEDNSIPGFTSGLLLSAVVIAVAIYKKKR